MPVLILKILIIEFAAGFVFSAVKKDWPMALYFMGAVILNVGVMIK